MRFFSAQISTETNTFSSSPTGWGGFEEFGLHRGDASIKASGGVGVLLRKLRDLTEADGHELVESVCVFAQPSGRTLRPVYEDLRDQLLADLRAAGKVDAVLLFLHGAMAAQGYDDCEGDILTCVRNVVGPNVPIGAELDLHCHLTEAMCASADVLISYKEYPHTDMVARASELYSILSATAKGLIRPCTAVFDCKMVGAWRTTTEPMKSFVARMQSFENRDGVLSVSLGHGFPWGDVPEAGAKLWVVTDGDLELAREVARLLGQEFWELRHSIASETIEIDAAIDQAQCLAVGPVVLADSADNPGGGAPGDSTFILQRLVSRGIGNAVLGAFWDLGAVHACKEAGVGAMIDLRIGGKCGPSSGDPVDLRVIVRAVRDEHAQTAGGRIWPMGTSVWVEAPNGIHLLLVSLRCQILGTDAFTVLGIDLSGARIVVVKSSQHFYADFAPIAKAVLYVSTPGAITPDFARIAYKARDLNYWPRVENPHCE